MRDKMIFASSTTSSVIYSVIHVAGDACSSVGRFAISMYFHFLFFEFKTTCRQMTRMFRPSRFKFFAPPSPSYQFLPQELHGEVEESDGLEQKIFNEEGAAGSNEEGGLEGLGERGAAVKLPVTPSSKVGVYDLYFRSPLITSTRFDLETKEEAIPRCAREFVSINFMLIAPQGYCVGHVHEPSLAFTAAVDF
jgi:hypothetical protein